jgi:hypothetical protein
LLAGVVFGQDLVIRGRCIGVHDGDSCTLLATGNVQIEVRSGGPARGYQKLNCQRFTCAERTIGECCRRSQEKLRLNVPGSIGLKAPRNQISDGCSLWSAAQQVLK